MNEPTAHRLLQALAELVRREQGLVRARCVEGLTGVQRQISPVIRAFEGAGSLPAGTAGALQQIRARREETAEQLRMLSQANRQRRIRIAELRARIVGARTRIHLARPIRLNATA